MPIGGSSNYPTLQSMTDLFRSQVNDDFMGATGTSGEGLINYNTAPQVLVFLNAAIRDLYTDLRNVGDPELLIDNYLLIGLPALPSPDPTVQVALSAVGYFDGITYNSQWILPSGLISVERMWERQSGSGSVFTPMTPAPFGINPTFQGNCMGVWEMRQNQVWMPGALMPTDLRMRCRVTFPDFLNPETLDFSTAYIPILDCQNAIVDKMCLRYARRFAPEQYPVSKDAAADSLSKLRLEIVRQMQNTQYQRDPYGDEAVSSFGASWMAL